MADQAEKLRKIMKGYSKAKFIAVTSGKGGVGKTNFTVNLAISLKKLGYKVVIVDGDLGLANVDVISGINLKYNVLDMFVEQKSIFEIMAKGPCGIEIISGGSGIKELLILNNDNLNRFIKEIEKLEYYYDFVIIDTGAGISQNIIKFLLLSDELVLITTPDPTSLVDGYALLKAIIIYRYTGKIRVVVNMVKNKKEAEEIYRKLNNVCNNFLGKNIEFLGYLNKSYVVVRAVENQNPFILDRPNSSVSKKIKTMAFKFDNKEVPKASKSKSFSQRIRGFLGQGG